MSFLRYSQRLVDLHEHGVLALTLGSTAYAPLPAHLHGFARWHRPAGDVVDCVPLIFRAVAAADMMSTVERVRSRLAHAVAAVRGYHDWVAEQISSTAHDAPTAVAGLAVGRVLLLFGSEHRPHALRLVDIPGQRIVWDETVDALRQRLQIALRPFAAGDALLYGSGADVVLLGLGDMPLLLRVGDAGLERLTLPNAPDWLEGEFVATHFVSRDRETLRLSFVPLHGGAASTLQPRGTKSVSYFVPISAASAGTRVALSYEGGLVELIEDCGERTTLMRPLPHAAGKDVVAIDFSPSGRYMVASIFGADTARLLDLERRLVADVQLPPLDLGAGADRGTFVPEPRYTAAWAVTDRGGYLSEGRQLTFTPFEALDWRSLDTDRPRPSGPDVGLAALVAAWTRPALALTAAKKGQKGDGASHLYGAPVLGGDWAWPEHEGVPMWLLCELDLAQVHAIAPGSGLPTQGALLVFVAVDREGEPVMRENSFDPALVRVLHLAQTAPAGTAPRDNPWGVDAQPLKLRLDKKSDWPQADAAVVRAAKLSETQLADYHEQLEAHAPNGAAGGHRLGGYPHLLQSNILEVQADAASRGLGLDSTDLTWEAAAGWRLLLQLDSDDVYMWGTDSGMLYFMIRDDDLARADFSRVVALTAGC